MSTRLVTAPHVPVLIGPLIAAVAPVAGLWIDGTFGAGGYTQALLDAGAARVIGIDRDAAALALGREDGRLRLVEGRFSALDTVADGPVDGVVLDLGVSSMQLDAAARGFSFRHDGPLDMRMGGDGPSAADLVAEAPETVLADILYQYGEERAARRIARAIVARRAEAPYVTTLDLARTIEACLPRPRPGQIHPATRSFQALRIAVNAELDELAAGLAAAERALAPGGRLAVVTFHSLEDRIVKRFLALRGGAAASANRYAPETPEPAATFRLAPRRALGPSAEEAAANPRARSAKLRVAIRTDAPAGPPPGAAALGLPQNPLHERAKGTR